MDSNIKAAYLDEIGYDDKALTKEDYKILVALSDHFHKLAEDRIEDYLAATGNQCPGSIQDMNLYESSIDVTFYHETCGCCPGDTYYRTVPSAILWDESILEKAKEEYRLKKEAAKLEQEKKVEAKKLADAQALKLRELQELERLKAKYEVP